MNFLEPYYLILLIFIPALATGAVITRRRKNTKWKKIVASRLEENLVIRHRSARFLYSTTLILFALTFLIIALARPYSGQTTTNEQVKSRNIMIAIDVSKSMLCQDITTDRLTAAKALGIQLLGSFPNDYIGAIAFAGTPYTIAPLTIDHGTVKDTISQLDINSIPTHGSDLITAIKSGVKALKETGHRANALIVLSDGSENQENLKSAIYLAKKANVQIFTIGVGTPSGGIIPDKTHSTQKHHDQAGRVVYTKLEDQTLRQLAESTDGIYIPYNSSSPTEAISSAIKKMKAFEQEGRETVIPHELYHWFLIPGFIFAITSALVRAKWKLPAPAITTIVIFSLTASQNLSAAEWLDKLKEKYLDQPSQKQTGLQAFQNKDYKTAIAHLTPVHEAASGEDKAQLSIALGEAHFRLNQLDSAASYYSNALLSKDFQTQEAAYLNTAHTLFKQQWSPLKIESIDQLKPTLLQALQNKDKEAGLALEKSNIESMEIGFTNALQKYQDISEKNENVEDHITSTKQIIKIIQEVLTPPEEQKDENKNQDKEDKEDKKDKKDPQDKQDEKKPKDGQEDKPEENKENGDKPKDNQEGKGDQPQDKKEGGDKPQDQKNNKDNKDDKPQNDNQKPRETQRPNPNDNDPQSRARKARSALSKHADLQPKPTERQSNWRSNPPVDW